jgi:hypothetical protein
MGTTTFTGPLQAGNVLNSDGSGVLAAAGSAAGGTQNVGYCVMAQSCHVTQATNGTVAGKFTTPIVVPANSQILSITLSVVGVWSGSSSDFTVTATDSAGGSLSFSNGTFSAAAVGLVPVTPGTDVNTVLNWANVGYNQSPDTGIGAWGSDIQFILNSSNTGTGTGFLTVTYIQSNSLNVSYYE